MIHFEPSRPMYLPNKPEVKALINGNKIISKYIFYLYTHSKCRTYFSVFRNLLPKKGTEIIYSIRNLINNRNPLYEIHKALIRY